MKFSRAFSAILIGAAMLPALDNFASAQDGWITLFDGKSLNGWDVQGNANWKLDDEGVQADDGSGFLVSKQPYKDFELKVEFLADESANSGVFIRCSDPAKIAPDACYEINIYDKRADPNGGNGAIVNTAKPSTFLKVGGKWSTYEITARGDRFSIVLNGTKTVDGAQDAKHAAGHIALQRAAGTVKFRKVQIRPL